MKKRIISAISAIAVAVTVIAVPVFSQPSRGMDKKNDMLIEGRPFFTDASLYNSYHLFGSPLGRFEMDTSSRMGADVGFRYFSLGGEQGTYLSGQTVRMGLPRVAFFEVFYGPDFLSRSVGESPAGGPASADATLQRFGLTLVAFQASGGFFRGAISGEGYVGGQNWKEGDSSRSFMGVEKVRLDVGSQPHSLVRITGYISATAHLDTLFTPAHQVIPDTRVERIFQMNMPEIGGNVDFGGDGLPVRSNLAATLSWSRFVYTLKGLGGRSGEDGLGNEYAIVNDSFQLHWLTHGRIPFGEGDDYVVKPGLLLGFSANTGDLRFPHKENDPFNIGSSEPGREYELGGFYFGVGSGFELLKYADIYMEYSLAAMSLKCGSKYPDSYTDSRTLHHVAFGVSTSMHRYLDCPFEITPRLAYFISGSSGAVGPPHSSMAPMNTFPGRSMERLYNPHTFLEGFTRTSGFTFGMDALMLENMLSLSYWMTFLSRKTDSSAEGGMELGLSLGFRL